MKELWHIEKTHNYKTNKVEIKLTLCPVVKETEKQIHIQ